jgi:hypothetical protein
MNTNDVAKNQMSINFFHKMRDKKSDCMIIELQSFINLKFSEICEQTNKIDMIAIAVQDFISKMTAEFAKVWRVEFTNNREAYVEISDGFESIVTKSLYYQLMEYFKDEKKIEKLYRKYSFINLRHLGFDFILDEIELVNQLKCN